MRRANNTLITRDRTAEFLSLTEYPPPWVRIFIYPGVMKGGTPVKPSPGRWMVIYGELGPRGEKLSKVVCEGGKGRPQFVLSEGSRLVVKDLELIYNGTRDQLAHVPKSASFTLENVKLTLPKPPR
jgi:hypothetical protein